MNATAPPLPAGPGRLIVLSGPSGVGKDTVLQAVFALDPSLAYSVSYTTREPRPGEVDGVAYTFIDDAHFDSMIERGEFLEWAHLYTHRSGTALQRVHQALREGRDIVLKIDVQGAARVRQLLDGQPVFIFLAPPDLDELLRRLRERGTEDSRSLALRRDAATRELAEQATYDHTVVNDDVERAAREILDIIHRDRMARSSGASAAR